MQRRRPRFALAALVLVIALVVAGCSQSNDPATWQEAEDQGDADGDFPVRTNFIDACELANADQDGMSAEDAVTFCDCAFVQVRESLTFEEFEQLDDDLRSDPEDLRADVRELFEGCAAQVA